MRYHLDTSFLVDWQRGDDRVKILVEEILAGDHVVSVDPVVQTEFFAAKSADRKAEFIYNTATSIGTWIPLTPHACLRAAAWLAPMNREQRRAFFADALVAAVAHAEGAVLLSGDATAAAIFPVPAHLYRLP